MARKTKKDNENVEKIAKGKKSKRTKNTKGKTAAAASEMQQNARKTRKTCHFTQTQRNAMETWGIHNYDMGNRMEIKINNKNKYFPLK